MPYFIFPENKDVVAVTRDQVDFMSTDYRDSLKREVRMKRHAETLTKGHGSPSRGKPYAQLGEVDVDLQRPPTGDLPIRIVYPDFDLKFGAKKRPPRQVIAGTLEPGVVTARDYQYYYVVVPPDRKMTVTVRHADGGTCPADVFICTSNTHPASSDNTWRELGGASDETVLTILPEDPFLVKKERSRRPGMSTVFFVSIFALVDFKFTLGIELMQPEVVVPALSAVGSRQRGKHDGYTLIQDNVKRSQEVCRMVSSGASYVNAYTSQRKLEQQRKGLSQGSGIRPSTSEPQLAPARRAAFERGIQRQGQKQTDGLRRKSVKQAITRVGGERAPAPAPAPSLEPKGARFAIDGGGGGGGGGGEGGGRAALPARPGGAGSDPRSTSTRRFTTNDGGTKILIDKAIVNVSRKYSLEQNRTGGVDLRLVASASSGETSLAPASPALRMSSSTPALGGGGGGGLGHQVASMAAMGIARPSTTPAQPHKLSPLDGPTAGGGRRPRPRAAHAAGPSSPPAGSRPSTSAGFAPIYYKRGAEQTPQTSAPALEKLAVRKALSSCGGLHFGSKAAAANGYCSRPSSPTGSMDGGGGGGGGGGDGAGGGGGANPWGDVEEGCGDTRLSTPQAFRLRVRRGEYLRMQEVYHEKLAAAISTFEVERPQTRAFRSSAMGATLGQLPPSQQHNPDVALQAMRTQSLAIHAEYKRLHKQRQSVLGRKAVGGFGSDGSLFARKMNAVAPRLQAVTAVRMMGRELGVKDRPTPVPRSLERRASVKAVTASVRMIQGAAHADDDSH